MLYQVFVEKRKEFAEEAAALLADLQTFLGVHELRSVRIVNRYYVENVSEEVFAYASKMIFSEPQVDTVSYTLETGDATVFAVEFLPGQFDQRAASAAECIALVAEEAKPLVQSAKVYLLEGDLTAEQVEEIKNYVINPVEAREASLEKPETIVVPFSIPTKVASVEGLIEASEGELANFLVDYSLAMDFGDIKMVQEYFQGEKRNPTITELRVIDTYWSDHCRHTTFNTIIDKATFADPLLEETYQEYVALREELGIKKPITLMDLGTISAKHLKRTGGLQKLDESEEINACTVKVDVEVDGRTEPYLLLFKNETHNHPTEIEPFGGAATCVGGAIRDPLSGRAYVYGAMRVTGAGNPLTPVKETIPGKLPQRKIVTGAAAGYASYGNQIGIATGIVDEIYHPGYAAKRMEIGAVIASAPAANVVRQRPEAGDVVILLGGATGRDGIGGATGSSKSHDINSVATLGAEVQKGNAPEERKIQRLFRNPVVTKMIKRCNDFGAGGVSVAIGELAAGVHVYLDRVPKKYEGLDGTELAISESQERMAVVVAKEDAERFIREATAENVRATVVADVTEEELLHMEWNGQTIVHIRRDFLDTNGAKKHVDAHTTPLEVFTKEVVGSFKENYLALVSDLNICSQRGLVERFDSTIGTGTVVMPFGGKHQRTPSQAMIQKISMEKEFANTCSFMSWGFNPYMSEKSPYHGAYMAVVESVCKLVASGASFDEVYLTFQEYFEKLGTDATKWGKPLAALLGAFKAQKNLGIAAIGGKDSMSGTFENLHVPPTLVSFAVTTDSVDHVITSEFKGAGHDVVLLAPQIDENGLPVTESLLAVFETITAAMRAGKVLSCYTLGMGGIADGIYKMAIGNGIGLHIDTRLSVEALFKPRYGAFLLEVSEPLEGSCPVGATTVDPVLQYGDEKLTLATLDASYEAVLEGIYPLQAHVKEKAVGTESYEVPVTLPTPKVRVEKPRVVIPVFPGTNCEYDTAKAFEAAGAEARVFLIRNLDSDAIRESVKGFVKEVEEAQMIVLPGGFSAGDEPEGSAKMIATFFRNPAVKDAVHDLLDNRDGLMAGICNGFQALIKLGLLPYGRIMDTDASFPTLSYNTIARHQSKIVSTRVASTKSPWLRHVNVGEVYNVAISHGEGRFIASDEVVKKLFANGQVLTQYVDLEGKATMDIQFNPNGSAGAIEGILSPDGRILGKMGHSERVGYGLYKNVPGAYDMQLFKSAVEYFK